MAFIVGVLMSLKSESIDIKKFSTSELEHDADYLIST